jgi:serine/threonine protein kinase
MASWSNSYICESLIGSGTFSSVYVARHRSASVRIAIKLINRDQPTSGDDRPPLANEIGLLREMNHPFIAKLFFVADENDRPAIAQEYAPNGTMIDYVTERGALSEEQLQYYFAQLVSVLDYLHNVKKVAHRDLKLENILLDCFNNVKVIDFGLSQRFSDDEDVFTTFCGSGAYLSPELVTTGECTPAADIWSLGIVLFACATARLPFFHDNFTELCRQITSSDIYYPMNLSDDLIDLLRKMLCRDPSRRITISQIKAHPWFPAELYAYISAMCEMADTSSVDSEIVSTMEEIGIDCSTIANVIKAGGQNDETILYDIYARQEQCIRMAQVLGTARMGRAASDGQVSLRSARNLPAGHTSRPSSYHGPTQPIRSTGGGRSDKRPPIVRQGQRLMRRPAVARRRGWEPIIPIRVPTPVPNYVAIAGH